jgi:hypothetical protein
MRFYPIILDFCNIFIAYNLKLFFFYTKYTSPKLPLPSRVIGVNECVPITSSSSSSSFSVGFVVDARFTDDNSSNWSNLEA